jgi:mono/diheme cytochrome c family protein
VGLILRIFVLSATLNAAGLPREIRQIFESRCYRCHGEDAKAGLRLDRPEDWEEDVPDRIWTMVSGAGREIMPPTAMLSRAELAELRKWIKKGAQR